MSDSHLGLNCINALPGNIKKWEDELIAQNEEEQKQHHNDSYGFISKVGSNTLSNHKCL